MQLEDNKTFYPVYGPYCPLETGNLSCYLISVQIQYLNIDGEKNPKSGALDQI